MTALVITSSRRRLTVSSPVLLPKKKVLDRRVFLSADLWAELSEAAEFHQAVFSAMGADETVSRNDVVAAFLQWAVVAYWEDKGGKPTSKADAETKAKRHAEQLAKALK